MPTMLISDIWKTHHPPCDSLGDGPAIFSLNQGHLNLPTEHHPTPNELAGGTLTVTGVFLFGTGTGFVVAAVE